MHKLEALSSNTSKSAQTPSQGNQEYVAPDIENEKSLPLPSTTSSIAAGEVEQNKQAIPAAHSHAINVYHNVPYFLRPVHSEARSMVPYRAYAGSLLCLTGIFA